MSIRELSNLRYLKLIKVGHASPISEVVTPHLCYAASVAGGIRMAACLEQEPGAALGLVNPPFDEAGSGDVRALFADAVDLAQTHGRKNCCLFATRRACPLLRRMGRRYRRRVAAGRHVR